MERCLVTGANGHLGYALVKELRTAGYAVRASVRDVTDAGKTARLRALDSVEIVQADLFRPEELRAALEGIDVLFQVAATYEFVPKVSAEAIVRTSLEGGMAILEAAADGGVRRVVYTSSCAAVGVSERGGPVRDESCWNQDWTVPYVRAKTLAERRAWQFAEEAGLSLVTLLPGAIGGPGFQRPTPSIDILDGIRRGSLRFGTPRINFPYVDVRDVAAAHRLAAEKESARGRYLVCNDQLPTFRELAEALHAIDSKVPRPPFELPDAFLGLLPAFDIMGHRLLGLPRVMTRELVASLGRREWKLDNSRARRELGWRPRIPLAQSLADTLATLEA